MHPKSPQNLASRDNETDFGLTLYEVLSDVRPFYTERAVSEPVEIARSLILGLAQKGLVSLCRLTPENTNDHVCEVGKFTSMTIDEIKSHMTLLNNWQQPVGAFNSSISYELAPTDLGGEFQMKFLASSEAANAHGLLRCFSAALQTNHKCSGYE